MAQWLTIKHLRSFTVLHTRTSDIIISSSSPQCYKIYWLITLKDLFVSGMLNNWLKGIKMDMGEGVKCHFLGDVLNGCSPRSPSSSFCPHFQKQNRAFSVLGPSVWNNIS